MSRREGKTEVRLKRAVLISKGPHARPDRGVCSVHGGIAGDAGQRQNGLRAAHGRNHGLGHGAQWKSSTSGLVSVQLCRQETKPKGW